MLEIQWWQRSAADFGGQIDYRSAQEVILDGSQYSFMCGRLFTWIECTSIASAQAMLVCGIIDSQGNVPTQYQD